MTDILDKFYNILDEIIEEKGRVPRDTEQAQRVYDTISAPMPPEAMDAVVISECKQRIKWLETPELIEWVKEVRELAEAALPTDRNMRGRKKNSHIVMS